jgi:NAD(P)-dependent dehydrogenase (short-subunit alcohol dehydrogenase family)
VTHESLARRAIIVTGARGALGTALVRHLVSRGARLVAGDINEEDPREAWDDDQTRDVVPVVADVATPKGARALVETCVATFGRVDGLVNNAAIAPPSDSGIESSDPELWMSVLKTNLIGPGLCLAAAVPHLSTNASVVNVASFVALLGSADAQPAYVASKGGLVSFTREAAVALAGRGVRVNAVCPGPLETILLPDALRRDPAARRQRLAHIPLGRFGTPDDVAPLICFLLSDEARYITGAVVPIDGGIGAAYVTSAD